MNFSSVSASHRKPRNPIWIAFLAILLWPMNAHSVLVTESSMIRIDYDEGPSEYMGGYGGLSYLFSFSIDGDRFDQGEGWRIRAFNPAGELIGSSSYEELSFVYGGSTGIGLGIAFDASAQPAPGVGYLVFDTIKGSFDLQSVRIDLFYPYSPGNGYTTGPVPNRFEVTQVPLPSSAGLFLGGFLALLALRIRPVAERRCI